MLVAKRCCNADISILLQCWSLNVAAMLILKVVSTFEGNIPATNIQRWEFALSQHYFNIKCPLGLHWNITLFFNDNKHVHNIFIWNNGYFYVYPIYQNINKHRIIKKFLFILLMELEEIIRLLCRKSFEELTKNILD